MKLPAEGARWLIALRWWACAAVLAALLLADFGLQVLAVSWPLYVVAAAIPCYNLLFHFSCRDWTGSARDVQRNIALQVGFDLTALLLLFYFADLPHNPFLFYAVFHMIISGMYLRGLAPYGFAAATASAVGGVMLLEYYDVIPRFPLRFGGRTEGLPLDGIYLLWVFTAFATTIGMTVYFTTSIRRYVDQAHAAIRQKEKLLGIGQLVAGIAHQIANPLDGLQNCLKRIGDRLSGDPQATAYVQMMVDALERIERTAKRVQAFARPRGMTLQSTDVNAVIQATLQVLGPCQDKRVRVETDLGTVPPADGDPYTLQEVLFNLCTNALAAMPDGGTLALHTRPLGRRDDDQANGVAIEVIDTGVGIPRTHWEKIFEPFFTTRAQSGGTGLGLGLCRMLISEMGGRIDVQSVVGRGTTFTVTLNPATQPMAG